MARFNEKRLNEFDVMEHISNIYNIVGTTDPKSVESDQSHNITERLNEIQRGKFIQWQGTQEEYDIAVANGTIKPGMLCAITDDYYNPDENSEDNTSE